MGDPEINTRIAAYEMAYRMQSSAPEFMDLKGESKETLGVLYGVEPGKPASFAMNCSVCAPLGGTRGVRFINLYHEGWDHHSDVAGELEGRVPGQTDQGRCRLIQDLKRRGLLADTLIVWGGEFDGPRWLSRTRPTGPKLWAATIIPQAFTMWLAGGGVKGGQTMGQTDDLGFHITDEPVHVHDLQAIRSCICSGLITS